MVGLGTFILWFGWLGFNGGSAFGANLRAIAAIWNSMLAAAFGGVVWCALDYRVEKKLSFVGFCSGTIAGLVGLHRLRIFCLPGLTNHLLPIGCRDSRLGFHPILGFRYHGYSCRRFGQLWYKKYGWIFVTYLPDKNCLLMS